MSFVNTILDYFWSLLTWGGGVVAIFGVFRLILAGSQHDGAAQSNAVWIIAAGAAMAIIGAGGSTYLTFPTL